MSRFECGHMLPKMHECSVCLRAEIERLRAALDVSMALHVDDTAEIERLRAALLKEGIRSTERERAALEEAAKIAEANAHGDCEVAEVIAAAIRAKAKRSEVRGE